MSTNDERVKRAMIAATAAPSVNDERVWCFQVAAPTVGSQWSGPAKICISTMPSAKAGKEMPDTASVMPSLSGQRLRHTAETTPMSMPNVTDHDIAASVSQKVGMKRSPTSMETGRLVRNDRPKSPCRTPVAKRTNCSGRERSSPRSWRTRATVSGVASCPAASRAGSPGKRCTNMNTSTPTMSSVGSSPSRRLTMYWSIDVPRGRRPYACAENNRGGGALINERPPRIGSGLQVDFVEVERCVRNDVDAGELLAMRGEQALGDQRRPRRVFPDLFLRILVELGLFAARGGELRAFDGGVDLRALVVRGG